VLYLIPLIPAVACWLLFKLQIKYLFRPLAPLNVAGLKLQGLLPHHKQEFVNTLSQKIYEEIGDAEILQQLAGADTLEKVKPLIESHIDTFLHDKLKTAMPVVGMFIGEKISARLKELFMQELEDLFPSVMSQFIGGLSHSDQLRNEIVVKLSDIQIDTLEEGFYDGFKKELFIGELFFAFVGLAAGVIQLAITIALLR
jgi:uncharacterized membrane protein YheB (UPF0754 family)